MERFSAHAKLTLTLAAVAGLSGLAGLYGGPRIPAGRVHPEKLCLHCKRKHTTGKPFCSADCCRKERNGEPRPEPPQEVVVHDQFGQPGLIVIIRESVDAPAQSPETA